MSYRGAEKEKPQDPFPDRLCEVCGRKGGGNPNKGLDNVSVFMKHQLCGHCSQDFYSWRHDTDAERLGRWIADQAKAKGAPNAA